MANTIPCVNGLGVDLNYSGLTLVSGDTVYASGSDGKGGTVSGCYEIIDNRTATGSTIIPLFIYSDCYDCLNENYGVVNFASCDGAYTSLQAPISSFGVIPFSGQVFYGTFDVNGGEGTILERITTCWVVDVRNPITQYTESQYAERYLSTAVAVPTSQTSCQSCLSANSVTYSVTRCVEGSTDYVLLIGDQYTGNTISYTDGTNQYCGVVVAQGTGSPELTFVFDYGNPGEGDYCGDCLSASNQKLLLESCINPEIQYVVWASTLFGIGDFSHLSTDDGCFRVVGSSDQEVDNINFLNFVPSPGCDPCIECNGIAYEFATCSEEPTTGTVYLYQYLPSGTTYFDPVQQRCATIGNTTTGGGEYTLYGVNTFDDCTNCTETVNIESWYGTICETGEDIYVTTVSSAGLTAGNVVKTMWGSNEYVCVELISLVVDESPLTYYDTKKDSLGNTELYDGCGTCLSNSNITVGLINCDTDEESFVTISLSNYLSIIGNGFTLPNYTIRDKWRDCYTITSVCPLPNSASTENITAVYFYYSCQYCPEQIIESANAESTICVICCDCGATGSTVTSVSPPHPIYTDGYNNPIMQLNMVVLGGPNGLNN